ncbi:MAG: carbon-nitrogen hydrolase family protein [Rhodothalassiaceae bacterium]
MRGPVMEQAASGGARVAVIQAAPCGFDSERTIAKCADLAADAARGGAQLAVFPEAFIGCYPKGIDFGARLGSRSAEGREVYRRYAEAAIAMPGPRFAALQRAVKAAGLHVVIGVIERAGGTLYCTALLLAPDGRLIGRHHKLMPTALERLVWGCGDGATMRVHETPLGRVGMAICWENYMPLYRAHLYAQGVAHYCAPTVDDREEWQASMRHIALEGRCFVLAACQYLERRHLPPDIDCIQGNDPASVLIRGGSTIISPLGDVLAGPIYGAETTLFADIDMAEIARGKYDLDVAGHYARPDVFRLLVDDSEKPFSAPMPDAD